MADFGQSFKFLQVDEGKYVNDPHDTGGETYMGIARNKQPNWDGWVHLDRLKSLTGFPLSLESDGAFQASVQQFYRKQYWRFDGIQDQSVANKLFDEAVNMEGSGDAGPLIKLAQTAARYLSPGSLVSIDGQYGPQTEALLNSIDPVKFQSELDAQIAVYYCRINKPEYLLGWMRRATRLV